MEIDILPEQVTLRSDMNVELVDCMADDLSVIRAARVSTGHDRDESSRTMHGLIGYLMKNKHGSPFEHNSFKFRISAPIFVFREFHRHRIGWSYNEQSGRYMELKPVFYTPSPSRKLRQQGKPGHYEMMPGSDEDREFVQTSDLADARAAWASYRAKLDRGICNEVARNYLPLSIYSTMYATGNARSLMHFLALRTVSLTAAYPSHPLREIEAVAEMMENYFARFMPATHTAFIGNGRVCP